MSEPATPPPERKVTPPAADNPYVQMIHNPAARTYLLIAAGGLVLLAAVYGLFLQQWVAAAVVLLLGGTGLALRWVVGPPAVVVVVCYFAFFPDGIPYQPQPGNQLLGRQTQPNLLFIDLMLTVAAMVYLLAAFRFFAVMRAGMPFDAPTTFVKPGVKATVRPAVPVREAELLFVFARVGVAVLAGQLLWLVATKLKVDFRNGFPLRPFNNLTEESGYTQDYQGNLIDPGALTNSISRFMIVAAVVLGLAFAVWLVFWYWRLHVMNRDEARAVCLDTQWTTNRREYNRPEKWRGWAKHKGASALPKVGCWPWVLAALVVFALPCLLSTVFTLLRSNGAFR